jgi:hypothetical protein
MALNFRTSHKKRIACCIVDNHNRLPSEWGKAISRNISDFLVHRFSLFNYDIYISESEDDLLQTVSQDEFYTHAVVLSSGLHLGLSDRIFNAIDEKCKEDFFIAGHILHRNENSGYFKDSYYELHHQIYLINLNEFRDIDCPLVGQQAIGEQHKQIEPIRSEEYLYDDHEVPVWIKQGVEEKTYNTKLHGYNIISEGLKRNKKFVDIGNDIRNNKRYFYYEYDHVFVNQLQQVYYDQLFVNNFFPSWNSDQHTTKFNFVGPVEQYVTVGIGLYWVTNLYNLGITDSTKVVFTDINNNTLNYMKKLVEEWDGNDYHLFYKNNLSRIPAGFDRDVNQYINYTEQEWINFREKYPNWLEMWEKIKTLDFDYILIDYMAKYDLNWLEKNKRTFINLSDVFTHSPYTPTQSFKYRVGCENRLIKKLQEFDSNIHLHLTSRATDGFDQSNRIKSAPVRDFKLSDMNTLTTPTWYKNSNEWQVPRDLI